MKLRTYKIYWTEHYPAKDSIKTLSLPSHKRIIGVLLNGMIKIEVCKEIRATNLDELIDILREVQEDEEFERFTVVNPEGINVLTETDLINRR